MSYSINKGNRLENAVRAIESVVLRTLPAYNEKSFLIQSKKIVVVSGVRHEIDIWVDIDLGKGYKTVFIFECKNWEEKVGKNEIIIFSEKIDAVGAHQGTFIARSFTSDAEAQAAKNPRMFLLLATEYPAEETPVPFDFHFICPEQEKGSVIFNERGESSARQLDNIDITIATAKLNGIALDLNEYTKGWVSEAINNRLRSFPSMTMPEGLYSVETTSQRNYEVSELVINDREIESASLTVEFIARITRPAVISHFEVETRGRSLSLAPVKISESGSISFGFVALH